jgi:hypothetical protein
VKRVSQRRTDSQLSLRDSVEKVEAATARELRKS